MKSFPLRSNDRLALRQRRMRFFNSSNSKASHNALVLARVSPSCRRSSGIMLFLSVCIDHNYRDEFK